MKKTALALGTAVILGAAGLAMPATAAGSLHVRISPKVPSVGQTVHVKATNAHAGQQYACVPAVGHRNISGGQSLADTSNVALKAASSSGVVRCSLTFKKFKGTYKGKSHSCPPTRKDKAHGWYCGVAVANLSNHNENALAKFGF